MGVGIGKTPQTALDVRGTANADAFTTGGDTLNKVIIWSGGCSSHGRAAGYNTYCLDQVEFNTAQGYLTVSTDGTVTVNKAGFYRINMWAISNVSNWAHVRILRNGTSIHIGHENALNSWTDNVADLTYRFEQGDTITVELYNSGGSNYAYHSFNTSGAHSRLQITYLGR